MRSGRRAGLLSDYPAPKRVHTLAYHDSAESDSRLYTQLSVVVGGLKEPSEESFDMSVFTDCRHHENLLKGAG